MNWYKTTLEVSTHGKSLYDITETMRAQLREWNVREGMCYVFIPHTSASLVMSENWDPTARADLESFMERLVPEGEAWLVHARFGRCRRCHLTHPRDADGYESVDPCG